MRRVKRPAGARGPAGHEKARNQDQYRRQIDPVAQHVCKGEDHIPRADHQRDEVITEAPQEQRGEQVDHHDHAMSGNELVIMARFDNRKRVWEPQLQPHQPRQHQTHQSDRKRSKRVLDSDDFGVLAKDVFRDPAFGVIKLDIFNFGWRDIIVCGRCDISHQNTLFAFSRLGLAGLSLNRADPLSTAPAFPSLTSRFENFFVPFLARASV
ncbi:hypothetical protein MnTg02_00519 [bacterium MnTg02]|nr:hypothetical protein MnTg02_00519 [bacterium MnTg02]